LRPIGAAEVAVDVERAVKLDNLTHGEFHQLAKQAAARRGQSGGHGFSYLVTCERSPPLHFMPVQPQVDEVLAVALDRPDLVDGRCGHGGLPGRGDPRSSSEYTVFATCSSCRGWLGGSASRCLQPHLTLLRTARFIRLSSKKELPDNGYCFEAACRWDPTSISAWPT
jgi:hypothetical protein